MKNSVFVRSSLVACCLLCFSGVASATGNYESAVLALSPTHYWRLNETVLDTNNATVIDEIAGLNGTHAGFFEPGEGEVGVPGPPVDGLEAENVAFGANNFASVGLGPGADLAASTMTVAAWFKTNGSEGGDRLWTNNQSDGNVSFQIFFGGGFGETAASIGIGLNPSINGFPATGLPSGPGVGNIHISDATVPTKDNEWHYIVASRNGNNIEDVIVVIDGVNYGPDTWADSTDTWGTTGTDAQIATRTPGDGGGSQQALNGSVDEVAVWLNRQLTVEESISLYNAAISPGVPGDFSGDGDVDGDDFLEWQRTDGTPGGLSDWQGAYPAAALSGATSVPEPASLTLMALFGVSLATMRRRK
ncbi:MAG: LamG domain-containing protein [Planctomycetes bacterium]|nr:LamG domain-containing protein [Planctomycetota bacterium]